VPPEEEVDALVGIDAEELSDDLYGRDLRIRELGCGSAASDAPPFETVVYGAEDGNDEGAKIQEETSVTFGTIGTTLSVGRSSLLLKSSKKTLHTGLAR
jgi:hypothetical protein